jgi:hypothetical protein
LIFGGDTWEACFSSAHKGLKGIRRWMDDNLLTLNVGKTKYTTFSIDSRQQPHMDINLTMHGCGLHASDCTCEPLQRVSEYKYLGIYIDRHLRWDKHVEHTTKKCRKMIYVFKVLRDIFPIQILRTIYFAMAQSIVEYGIVGWGGMAKTLLKPLNRAHRSIIKVMYRRKRVYPTEDLHTESGFLSIRQIYIRTVIAIIHFDQRDFLPNYILMHNTRNRTQLRPWQARTTFAQRSYIFLAPHIFITKSYHI